MSDIDKLKNEIKYVIKDIDPKLSDANRLFSLTNTLFNIIESQQKVINKKDEDNGNS